MAVTGTRIETRTPLPEVRRRATALTTYLPMGWLSEQNPPRWVMSGASISTMGCQQLEGNGEPDDICDYTVTERDPNLTLPGDSEPGDCIEFNPFEIYTQLEHKLVQGYSREELRQYMDDYALLHRSRIIAKETMTGYLTAANPSLVSVAETVTGLDTTVLGALAAVEDGLAARIGNGVGMIHLTPGIFTLLRGSFVFDDNEVRTITGHRVVADAGYTGGAPSTGTVTSGETWIYGSGPVYLETTMPEWNGDGPAGFELTTNTGILDVLQYAVVAFETCPVVAARVADVSVSVS